MKAATISGSKKPVRIIIAFFAGMALFAMATTAAHAVTEEWVARYDGTGNSYDEAKAIATDSAGNVYVTGQSNGSGTGWDYATVAYDPSGNQLWLARYDGPANRWDYAYAIATDSVGNVYVTGESYNGFSSDYATVAYDPSGNQLWAARYDGLVNSSDYAAAIATDSAGNVYVTGSSSGSGTGWDYATVAYDSSGNQLWLARYDGPGNHHDRAYAIATDSAGNVYVTGSSYGNGTYSDYATVAYDSSGNRLWVARYNGSGNSGDFALAMATDSAGNVYVTGHSRGIGTGYDSATVAYGPYGNQLWVARYNGPGNGFDTARTIATDSAGNVYVTGESWGSGTGYDYATAAYDPSGNQLWLARYDGPTHSSDYAAAIATDNAGNVYVTGKSYSWGTYYDYATIAYASSGKRLWMARRDGPAHGWDVAHAIATDNAGNVYVTGYSRGNGTYYDYDYATIKYSQGGMNQPPVADAGPDRTVEASGPQGANVTLDGSGSSDPKGDALTYTWSGPFGSAGGVSPTVTMPLGTNVVTLSVDDANSGTDTDTASITVQDTTPPMIIVSGISNGVTVTYELGLVPEADYEAYDLVSATVASEASLTGGDGHGLGEFTYTVTATDDAGNTATASVPYTVIATPEGTRALLGQMLDSGDIDPRMANSLTRMMPGIPDAPSASADGGKLSAFTNNIETQSGNQSGKKISPEVSIDGKLSAFINHVKAQSGKKITPEAAAMLVNAARYIRANN